MNALQPKFNREIINQRQTATNIAIQLRRAIEESAPAANAIAAKFKGQSSYTTCFNIYDFLKRNIVYRAEPMSLQTARTIQRMLNDMQNTTCYGDCKHYTTFACSILKALGIKTEMYLISQDFYNRDPTHIYCVAFVDGQKIIIDPCVNRFNSEARFRYRYKMDV